MYVIGTAGHVDHGKSTLIHALTGINPDRLKEEKERQMTIELGFAWTELPSGQEIGFVDVPGHRDFIENMLVGVGGIDAVLFIVAADEGVMPQTKEHLAILDLLDIQHGIVVLTKSDLIDDEEWLSLVTSDIKDLLASSSLSDATVVQVSAANNVGVDDLKTAIDIMLEKATPKEDVGRPRLPIDRIFSLRGFGTIVTGTLIDGEFQSGEQVVIQPSGIATRIRGLQTHKKKTEAAQPGSRTAVNLTNVEVSQINRGDVVTLPGMYKSTRRIDCAVQVLPGAAQGIHHNDEVKLFSGTNQVIARVRVLGTDEIQPGDSGYIQIESKDSVSVHPRDRFILRRPSPPETIAGGIILDSSPKNRHRRKNQAIIKFLQTLDTGTDREIVNRVTDIEGIITFKQLVAKTGLEEEKTRKLASQSFGETILLLDSDSKTLKSESLLISLNRWNQNRRQIKESLSIFHQLNPLKKGISKADLKRKIGFKGDHWTKLLDALKREKVIKVEGNTICLPDFELAFSDDQKMLIAELHSRLDNSPFSPPPYDELEDEFGNDLVQALVEAGDLVRTSDGIAFAKSHFEKMLTGTKRMIRENGSLTLAQFRDIFKTSRKYAASFLEYLDDIHVTERKGDIRVLKNIDN